MRAQARAISRTSKSVDRFLRDLPDFSLVLGGPVFQLLRGAHLTDDALELVNQRIIFISLFTWLPLLVLSTLAGTVFDGISVPFLFDVEVHVRFLVVIPLLIGAELVVHRRMRFVVRQFLERQLIPESAMGRFKAAITSVFRLRNSVLAEVLLFATAFATLYIFVGLSFPDAFKGISFDDNAGLASSVFYLSFVTLTSTGYGDLVAVHPIARSLCNLESVIGVLFAATLLARLVTLEMREGRKH